MSAGTVDMTALDEVAVGASTQFAITLQEGNSYVVTSTTGAWIKTGANPTAVARTPGNLYVPPNYPIVFVAPAGAPKVAIVQDAAGGFACIALCKA